MEDKVDNQKRKFLKALTIGGGVLFLGKLLGPKVEGMFYGPAIDQDFGQFKLSKNRKELAILSNSGEKILIVDNEKQY